MYDSKYLDALHAAADAACRASPWSTNGRFRAANAEVTATSGELIVCNINQTKERYSSIRTRTSFKINGQITSRAAVLLLTNGGKVEQVNEEIRVAFELQAPALIEAYADFLRGLLARELEHRGPSLKITDVWDKGRNLIEQSLKPICDIAYEKVGFGSRKILSCTLNEAKLLKVSTDYGYAASQDWFYKTNAKLGAVKNPVLVGHSFGDIEVRGIRNGKAVSLFQQRIFKVSVLGKPFLQFPARLYVDGKLTPEKQYRALFAPEAPVQSNPDEPMDAEMTDHTNEESNSP